jgi:hypothetical protein
VQLTNSGLAVLRPAERRETAIGKAPPRWLVPSPDGRFVAARLDGGTRIVVIDQNGQIVGDMKAVKRGQWTVYLQSTPR